MQQFRTVVCFFVEKKNYILICIRRAEAERKAWQKQKSVKENILICISFLCTSNFNAYIALLAT